MRGMGWVGLEYSWRYFAPGGWRTATCRGWLVRCAMDFTVDQSCQSVGFHTEGMIQME